MGYLYNDDDAVNCDHISGGHTEGLFEAWSNIYMRFAIAMEAMDKGNKELAENMWFPGIDAGIEGVRFVENCARSADNGSTWIEYK